jgi:hypothetical protein
MPVVLRVIEGPHQGQHFTCEQHDAFIVGRSRLVGLSLPEDPSLSRHHFLVEYQSPSCWLKDLGSRNGTLLNGESIAGAVQLQHLDLIRAGVSSLRVEFEQSPNVALPQVRCLNCGKDAPTDLTLPDPADSNIQWVCPTCQELNLRYPVPPPGYYFVEQIGEGGMGEVFKARHRTSGRLVAIKIMIPNIASSERARTYFRREIDVLRNLQHPNIVGYHGTMESKGQFQLIMEYVDGRNAMQWLEDRGRPMDISLASWIGVQLLEALDHAHSKGYVHRDIKPSNLLLTGSWPPLVKLTDFGLSKSFRDNAGFTGLTHQGDVGGSIGFIAPDHIRNFRGITGSADIYSATATLFYLLTREYALLDFDPKRPDAFLKVLEHPAVPLRAFRPDAPEALERVLKRGLQKQPDQRWATAGEMAKALRPFMNSSP